jgi:hypothetical protein
MKLQVIQNRIHEIRGHKVMLDFNLAGLYEVENRALKQAVKRNIQRFPADCMFQITRSELKNLTSQFVTSSSEWGGTRHLPFAFTEQGVAMLSGVLKSKKAVQVNIAIMRAFVFTRNYALSHKDLTEKLKELEGKYDKQFNDVYEAINFLLQKDRQETEQKERKRIGFKTNND